MPLPGRPRPPRRPAPAAGYAFLFTLLLVALLGVSLVVASEVDSTLTRREREAALLQVGHEFRQALARYSAARPGAAAGQYPLQLDELLLDPRQPRPLRHLRRLYPDPITGLPGWGLVRQNGRIVGIHSLADAVPIRQDNFDADDAAFKNARRYRDWVFLHPANRAPVPAASASSAASAAGAGPVDPALAAGSAPQASFGAVPPPLPAAP